MSCTEIFNSNKHKIYCGREAAKQVNLELADRNGNSCEWKLLAECYTTSNDKTGSCRVSSKSATNKPAAFLTSCYNTGSQRPHSCHLLTNKFENIDHTASLGMAKYYPQ